MTGSPETPPPEALTRQELRRRASAGVSLVASRSVAILVISTAGNIVVARLLTPHDLGLVAIGMSVVQFTSMVSDGGLGAALIRRSRPPTGVELQSLMALQLTIAATAAVAAVAVAPAFGLVGWVTAIMVASMPVAVLQFPAKIVMERDLSYRPLASIEIAQLVAYNATAIALVVAGLGVWGLAVATVSMRVAAAVLIARISPIGIPVPRFSWANVRPLMRFGLQFQATSAVWLVRDEGLNISVAAIASVATLGLWGLVRRLLDLPYLLLQALFRVSFPTLSRLVADGADDVAPLLERAVAFTAVGTGLIIAPLVGSAPGLVPGVFGAKWAGAVDAIPFASLGLMIAGPIAVAAQGYLYAADDARAVMNASILQTVALFVVLFPLLPLLGVSGIGLALLASFAVEALILVRALRRHIVVRVLRPLVVPVSAAICGGALGWVVSTSLGSDIRAGLAGGAASAACFLTLTGIFGGDVLGRTVRYSLESLRAARSAGA
jgi:O-antigen/teichoic acid export membrane protein